MDERDFWANADRQGDCLVWRGGFARRGYGVATWRGRARLAHRVAYELRNGPIPAGLNVLHACDNPPCIEPAHLWVGTQSENLLDAGRKGRLIGRQRDAAIRRTGPSFGLQVAPEIVKELGWKADDKVEAEVKGDALIVRRKK